MIFASYVSAFLDEIESVRRHAVLEHTDTTPAVAPVTPISKSSLKKKTSASPVVTPNPHTTPAWPVVVHCSAGVGRTGVVILAEVMKTCLEHNHDVALPVMLTRMREQRMHLVQTLSQYAFVYRTLITYLNSSRLI